MGDPEDGEEPSEGSEPTKDGLDQQDKEEGLLENYQKNAYSRQDFENDNNDEIEFDAAVVEGNQEYTITGLLVNRDSDYQGLFGCVNNG